MTTFERIAKILDGDTQPSNWVEQAFAAILEILLSDDVKDALLQVAEKATYTDGQGEKYYQDLYDAFYPDGGGDS